MGKWHFVAAAAVLSVLYWLIEAVEDTYIHHAGTLWENTLTGLSIQEIASRLFVIVGFFGLGIFIIISLRRRYKAEEVARRHEELLRRMIDEVPLLMDAMDRQGIIRVWNRQCELVTGYSVEEALNNPDFMQRIYPDDAYRARRIAQVSNKADHYKDHLWTITCKDGSERTIAWSNFTVDLPVRGWATWSVGRDVTEQLRRERQLQESERRYATLLGNLPGMAYRCRNDENWTMSFVNQGCRELTGWDAGDVMGNTVITYNDIIHPDDRELVRDTIQQALERNERFRVRYRIVTAGGLVKWVFEQGVGIARESDGETFIEGLITDISPQVEAEAALRESEERFRRLAENARDMIYRMRLPEGTYEYVSPACEDIYGYAPKEFYANSRLVSETVAPDWIPYFDREWKKLVTGAMSPTYEYQILHPQKGLRWVFQRNVLLSDDDGNPVAIEGIVTDITTRKHMEEALRESEHRFRQLAEHMLEVIWLTAVIPEPAMLYINRTVETMFGIMREDVYDKPYIWLDMVHEEDRGAVDERMACYNQGTCEFNMTFRIVHPDGKLRWIEAQFIPIFDANGAMYRSVGICRDITKFVEDEDKRRSLEAQLRHQQKLESIGTLASGVAHEINNPLNIVMNYAQLILDVSPEQSKAENFAREIFNESERIAEIVRNLLSFSRYEQRHREQADLAATLEATLSLTRSLLRKDHIAIRTDIQPGLPMVVCHRQQIQQVIMNLLTNARDAINQRFTAEDDDKTIVVRLAELPDRHKPWVRLTVEDNGAGIDSAIQDRVFDPFYTSKSRDQGTGLGLSISHGIVAEHGGRLWFESTPGTGTCFYVDIPVDGDGEPPLKQ